MNVNDENACDCFCVLLSCREMICARDLRGVRASCDGRTCGRVCCPCRRSLSFRASRVSCDPAKAKLLIFLLNITIKCN